MTALSSSKIALSCMAALFCTTVLTFPLCLFFKDSLLCRYCHQIEEFQGVNGLFSKISITRFNTFRTLRLGEFQGPKTLKSGPIFQDPKTLQSEDFQGHKTLQSGNGIYMFPPVVQEAIIKISYIRGIFHSSETPPPHPTPPPQTPNNHNYKVLSPKLNILSPKPKSIGLN